MRSLRVFPFTPSRARCPVGGATQASAHGLHPSPSSASLDLSCLLPDSSLLVLFSRLPRPPSCLRPSCGHLRTRAAFLVEPRPTHCSRPCGLPNEPAICRFQSLLLEASRLLLPHHTLRSGTFKRNLDVVVGGGQARRHPTRSRAGPTMQPGSPGLARVCPAQMSRKGLASSRSSAHVMRPPVLRTNTITVARSESLA